MKKVIVLHSTGGMGHKKAALALFQCFQKISGSIEVKDIDTIKYANKIYKFFYIDLYKFFMIRARYLWGLLYIAFDNRFFEKLRKFFEFKGLKGLDKMLLGENPDAIITTHFALPSIAHLIKGHKNFSSKLYVVITDYGPHSCWLSEDIDKYFIGAEPMVPELIKRGIPREKLVITGIPAVKEFFKEFDNNGLCGVYGLDKTKKTVFILSGGFGVGPMGSILLSLCSCRSDIQAIVVCGHNKTAYDSISKLKKKLDYSVKLFGFTDKIAEIMSVSDIMITKAGGISVTEALGMRLPMILFASVHGQETWNEQFLLESGAAKKAGNVKEIPGLVDQVLLSEDVYDRMKSGIERIRRPRAAENIVEYVLKDIEA